MNITLPAILVGGPPHAGKTVLLHSISRVLKQRNIHYYTLRACPDGEGMFSEESDPVTASYLRCVHKGYWSTRFVEQACERIEQRKLPFLVDMGGQPREDQLAMFRACTHSLLLLKEESEWSERWQRYCQECQLTPFAELISRQSGTSTRTSDSQVLRGIITGLERGQLVTGPLFEELVERIVTLFACTEHTDYMQEYLQEAPAQLLNLYELIPRRENWQPEYLPGLISQLAPQQDYAIYGGVAIWVYAAIAAQTEQKLYQFDIAMGWIEPVAVQCSAAESPELAIRCEERHEVQATLLDIRIPSNYLQYVQPEPLPFPAVPQDRGLILSGKLPLWLYTALVRMYKAMGVPWIATFEPRRNGGIVVYSRVHTHTPGNIIPLVLDQS